MNVTPGMFVRLSFDEGARSVGLVTEYAENREADGQTFVTVDWTWDADVDEPNRMNLPTSILTPICSWSEPVTDFDGARIFIPCHFDAAATFTWTDDQGEQSEVFCLDHATNAAADAKTLRLPFHVER
jgi:hypothetical protein